MNPTPNASALPASQKPSLSKLGFRVRWFTSEEKTNPASELITSSPASKGWQSSRFCTYPQEIILQLLQPSRLRQIQFLSHQNKISSKVEVLVCSPDGNADLKFRKLGFLTFDSNERTAFQSRELKSVFLDANCLYVKLVFHKYHQNKQNLFNQVGLIALSCFGEPSNGLQLDRLENLRERGEPQNDNVVTQFDNITMDRLRTLEAAKDRAVQNEEFEEAKRLKEAMSRLKQIALKLKQLEERKQLAVRNEDYESAKIIKAEIERLRNGVAPELAMNRPAPLYFAPSPVIRSQRDDIDQGLGSNRQQYQQQQQLREQPNEEGEDDEFNGDRNNNRERNESSWQQQQQQNNNNINQDSDMLSNKQDQQGQERSIRVNNNNNSFLNNNNNSNFQEDQFEQSEHDAKDFQQPAIPNHDDMVIPAIRNQTEKKPWEEDEEDQAKGASKQPEVPEGLSVENKKAAGILAPSLSQEYAELLYSKSWQAREQTIKALEKELSAPSKIVTTDMQQLFTAMTSACALSMADKVSQVSLAGVSLFISLCGSKTIKPTSSKGDLQPNFESALSVLVELAAASKSKTPAINAFFAAAELQPTGGVSTVISSLTRPQGGLRQKILNAPKYVIARIQVLDEFIKKNNKDTPIAPILEFTTKQVLHANGEVRAAATALLVNAAKTLGMPQVETYIASLPEEKRELIMTEIQGGEKKKPFSPIKEQTKKVGQLPGATSADGKTKKAAGGVGVKKNDKKKKILSAKGKKEPTAEELESNICEFCNKFSKEFSDKKNMDIHLWRECPMLLACSHCAQVIEVASYNQHLLEECSESKKFKQCKRCQEPILSTEYDAHTKSASCLPAKPIDSANRCPLCHQDIEPGIEGWKQHLAVKTCPNNERSNK